MTLTEILWAANLIFLIILVIIQLVDIYGRHKTLKELRLELAKIEGRNQILVEIGNSIKGSMR